MVDLKMDAEKKSPFRDFEFVFARPKGFRVFQFEYLLSMLIID